MNEIIRIAEQAHMAGQYSAGVDPSYSEARSYCGGLELPNVDELKAHVDRLYEYLKAAYIRLPYDDGLAVKIGKVLEKTPAQSLNHIKAQAIEEYQKAIKDGIYYIDRKVLDIGDDLISKYKEQSDED